MRRHRSAASNTGAVVLFACAELMIAFLLETVSTDISSKIFWTKVQYVGLIVAPTAWMIYSLQYTGRGKWLTVRKILLLSSVSLLIMVLVFTNEAHNLIWSDIKLDTTGPIPELEKTFGIGYWGMVSYLYAQMLVAGGLHVEMYIRSRRLFRWQAYVLIFATTFPYLGAAFDAFNISPLPRLVATSVGVMAGSLIAAFTIYGVRQIDFRAVTHQAVFERMGDAVIVLDAEGFIVDLNPSAQQLMKHDGSQAIGQPIAQIMPYNLDFLQSDAEASTEVVMGEENEQLTYDLRVSPLTDWRGQMVSRVMVLRDITERNFATGLISQKAEQLSRSNAFITALSRVSAHIMTTQDIEQVLETLGDELYELDILCMVTMLDSQDPSMVIRYSSIRSEILEIGEKLLGYSMRGFRLKREQFPIWDELIEQGQVTILDDEIAMVTSLIPGILRSLVERVFKLGGWNPEGMTYWLPLLIENQVIGAMMLWGPDLRESDVPILSVFAGQVASALESARLYAAEQERTAELSWASELLQQELTERKQAEQAIQASLKEKEVLLKEIHHRTKNNLQIISSLITLQSGLLKDERVVSIFDDSQSRIRSMALIHEMLYQSENLAEVKYSEYIHMLISHFRDTYYSNLQRIEFIVNIDEIFLSIDHAIPCGLILNELVSNALKYAFPNDQAGRISVDFQMDGKEYILRVQDNGVGLSNEIDFPNSNTLGLRLVSSLVDQLQGSITLDRSVGTKYTLRFQDIVDVG